MTCTNTSMTHRQPHHIHHQHRLMRMHISSHNLWVNRQHSMQHACKCTMRGGMDVHVHRVCIMSMDANCAHSKCIFMHDVCISLGCVVTRCGRNTRSSSATYTSPTTSTSTSTSPSTSTSTSTSHTSSDAELQLLRAVDALQLHRPQHAVPLAQRVKAVQTLVSRAMCMSGSTLALLWCKLTCVSLTHICVCPVSVVCCCSCC